LEKDAQLKKAKEYNAQVVEYYKKGQYQEALPWAEKAWKIRTEILGEKDSKTLTSLNNLAGIYDSLGRRAEALPLYEQGYRLRKEVLGDKHPDTLTSLNNLASFYQALGRRAEALKLLEQGYPLFKEVLGDKHPATLTSLNNLAEIYHALGRNADALKLLEQGYPLFKEVLGDKHPDTLTSLNNLAFIYSALGRFDKALPLFEQGYRLSKEVLGDRHPNTLGSLNNLADIYRVLGRLADALPLSEQGYRFRKEVLGDQHPDTLTSLNNLALIYQALGRLADALPLSKQGYRLRKEVLGDKHPDTLTSLNNLAFIYRALGRLADALPLSEQGYCFRKEVLGDQHPDTLISLNNLALIYQALGRLADALPLFEQNYHLSKEVLGDQHPDTLNSLNNLAGIYQALGRLAEALPLSEQGYRLSKEVLGDQHPDTLTSLNNLAYLYAEKNEIDKAIKHFNLFIDGVETLRSRGDLSADNRQTLFEKWTSGYFILSFLYLTQASRPHDAFRIAELTKARTLLEAMTLKLAIQQAGLSPTEQQQFQDYQGQQAVLTDRIAKEGDLNKRIELEVKKNQFVTQTAEFHRSLVQKYPKYADLNKIAIMEASQGAPLIPEDSLFISFLLSKDNVLLVFTLDHTGDLQAKDLGKIPNLESRLNDYRTLLSATSVEALREHGQTFWRLADGSFVSGNKPAKEKAPQRVEQNTDLPEAIAYFGRSLAKDLLVPIQDRLNTKRHWIISPDGALALIPFDTLILKDQPVIADHDLSYVQSLSVLALLKHREQQYQKSSRQELFAFGAPRYEHPDQPVVDRRDCNKVSPTKNTQTRNSDDPQPYFKALGIQWCNLPGAQRELDNLTKLFTDSQPLIIQGEQANEGRLKQLNGDGTLAHYQYLMFSTHGYLSNESPALSSLVLDQLQTTTENDDYITAGEWVGYTMKSDLMVLSACQTGAGKVQRGEGVLGLPYALYVAGNKNTLLTLWIVMEDSTADFTTRFFKKLKDGKGKVSQIDALMATKREFLKEEKYRLPVYWAAFVLYGI
jgi:CHAT domain-containing protein/predicted transporter